MAIEELLIKKIDTSAARSFRVSQHPQVIREYADARRAGDQFPPIVVFRTDNHLWLADGAHRIAAWELDKIKTIKADVRDGTRRDACLYAAGANSTHGMRRTLGDVGIIVTWFLRDDELKKWVDRKIARTVGCSAHYVGTLRKAIGANVRYRRTEDANGEAVDIDVTKYQNRTADDRPKPVTASVRCPHCGRRFQLLRGAP